MSDGHSSRFGRRRPYILGGLVSSTVGLLLVMYGQAIGDLLGDANDVHVRADVGVRGVSLCVATCAGAVDSAQNYAVLFTGGGLVLVNIRSA